MTDQAKHSPKPWGFHIADNASVPHIAIEDEAGNRLADIYYNQHGQETAEANAYVMQAAPDMLGALEDLVRRADDTGLTREGTNQDLALVDSVAIARAAIARAKGAA